MVRRHRVRVGKLGITVGRREIRVGMQGIRW